MRVDNRGAVPDEESLSPSCNILSKNLKMCHSKDSVNTVCCPVDSRLINAEFVSYNDRAPPALCLPSRLPDVTHVTLSPRPSPSVFAYSMRSKTGGGNGLGTRLHCAPVAGASLHCVTSLNKLTLVQRCVVLETRSQKIIKSKHGPWV